MRSVLRCGYPRHRSDSNALPSWRLTGHQSATEALPKRYRSATARGLAPACSRGAQIRLKRHPAAASRNSPRPGTFAGRPRNGARGPESATEAPPIRYHSTATSAYRPTPLSLLSPAPEPNKLGNSQLFRLFRAPPVGPGNPPDRAAHRLLATTTERAGKASNLLHFPALRRCLPMATEQRFPAHRFRWT